MNRLIVVAALTFLAALTTLSGCSQKATEPAGTPDASAATATVDEHSDAALDPVLRRASEGGMEVRMVKKLAAGA